MFQPVAPISGVAGLRFLERTREAQQAAFDRSPQLARDIAYFEEKIAGIDTAEALVGDRRLLRVALGAFGLDGEISKGFFLRKILEGGSAEPDALANRLVDPRYRAFAQAFGFGDLGGSRTGLPDFAQEITDAYRTRQFEVAVGNSDTSLRVALGFKREMPELLAEGLDGNTLWLRVLGSPPLREVFDTAFALPTAFATLDLDRQIEVYEDRLRGLAGSADPAQFADPEVLDRLVSRYLALSGLNQGAAQASSPALTLLQSSSGVGSGAVTNILLSTL
ncbi:MAG: DUF1217 domain-containing protein [Pseudomonadota bacterium]